MSRDITSAEVKNISFRKYKKLPISDNIFLIIFYMVKFTLAKQTSVQFTHSYIRIRINPAED